MSEITLEHLEQAISNYRDTPENWRNQQMMAFLYESHWLPTLAVVEEALKVAHAEQNFNTHRSVVVIAELIPYTRFRKIAFNDKAPTVPLKLEQTLDEVRLHHTMLSHIIPETNH